MSDLCCFALCHLACLLDICFVVDHSGSIRDANVGNWQLVLEFMANLVSYMDIGTYGTNVGSVMFGMYSDMYVIVCWGVKRKLCSKFGESRSKTELTKMSTDRTPDTGH